jgi:hypothetical protein
VHVCDEELEPEIVPPVAVPAVPPMEHAAVVPMVAAPDPPFCRVTTQLWVVIEQATAVAVTCGVAENVPKRPNTKPAMATAAINVIAMRMTVARTGEMAFLFFF